MKRTMIDALMCLDVTMPAYGRTDLIVVPEDRTARIRVNLSVLDDPRDPVDRFADPRDLAAQADARGLVIA